jgi:hypothetical protein
VDGCDIAQAEPGDLASKLGQVWKRRRRLEAQDLSSDFSSRAVAAKLQGFYQQVLQNCQPQHTKRSDSFESARVLSSASCR